MTLEEQATEEQLLHGDDSGDNHNVALAQIQDVIRQISARVESFAVPKRAAGAACGHQ
jgi:hypothetical protein